LLLQNRLTNFLTQSANQRTQDAVFANFEKSRRARQRALVAGWSAAAARYAHANEMGKYRDMQAMLTRLRSQSSSDSPQLRTRHAQEKRAFRSVQSAIETEHAKTIRMSTTPEEKRVLKQLAKEEKNVIQVARRRMTEQQKKETRDAVAQEKLDQKNLDAVAANVQRAKENEERKFAELAKYNKSLRSIPKPAIILDSTGEVKRRPSQTTVTVTAKTIPISITNKWKILREKLRDEEQQKNQQLNIDRQAQEYLDQERLDQMRAYREYEKKQEVEHDSYLRTYLQTESQKSMMQKRTAALLENLRKKNERSWKTKLHRNRLVAERLTSVNQQLTQLVQSETQERKNTRMESIQVLEEEQRRKRDLFLKSLGEKAPEIIAKNDRKLKSELKQQSGFMTTLKNFTNAAQRAVSSAFASMRRNPATTTAIAAAVALVAVSLAYPNMSIKSQAQAAVDYVMGNPSAQNLASGDSAAQAREYIRATRHFNKSPTNFPPAPPPPPPPAGNPKAFFGFPLPGEPLGRGSYGPSGAGSFAKSYGGQGFTSLGGQTRAGFETPARGWTSAVPPASGGGGGGIDWRGSGFKILSAISAAATIAQVGMAFATGGTSAAAQAAIVPIIANTVPMGSVATAIGFDKMVTRSAAPWLKYLTGYVANTATNQATAKAIENLVIPSMKNAPLMFRRLF